MSQKAQKNSPIYTYFELAEDSSSYLCQGIIVVNEKEVKCDGKIKVATSSSQGSRASNLRRHLERAHPKEYKELMQKEQNRAKNQTLMSSFIQTQQVTVEMSAKRFKDLIIDMVVHDLQPLSFFSGKAFMGLNGEMAVKLGVSLNREAVRKYVIDKADAKKEELRQILKNRLVYLKLDGVTRKRNHYLGINVRFCNDNGLPTTKILAVRDTLAKNKAIDVKKTAEAVLAEYGVKKRQILCNITDNARNMTKYADIIQDNDEKMDSDDELEDDMNGMIILSTKRINF